MKHYPSRKQTSHLIVVRLKSSPDGCNRTEAESMLRQQVSLFDEKKYRTLDGRRVGIASLEVVEGVRVKK